MFFYYLKQLVETATIIVIHLILIKFIKQNFDYEK
jgi:hypothetical protein